MSRHARFKVAPSGFCRYLPWLGLQASMTAQTFSERHSSIKPFTTESQVLMTLKQRAFENIERKGENAGNQHFLHFTQCFSTYQRKELSF